MPSFACPGVQVLRTLDFSKVHIDVLCIELDDTNPEKNASIREMLAGLGYSEVGKETNSYFFTHTSFSPSAKPR